MVGGRPAPWIGFGSSTSRVVQERLSKILGDVESRWQLAADVSSDWPGLSVQPVPARDPCSCTATDTPYAPLCKVAVGAA